MLLKLNTYHVAVDHCNNNYSCISRPKNKLFLSISMHSGPAPLKTELGDFLMIIRDNAGWALMGNRKQTKFSDFWPKSAHGRIRKSSSGRLRESFETPFD